MSTLLKVLFFHHHQLRQLDLTGCRKCGDIASTKLLGGWACGRCTLMNKTEDSLCQACGTPKTASDRWASRSSGGEEKEEKKTSSEEEEEAGQEEEEEDGVATKKRAMGPATVAEDDARTRGQPGRVGVIRRSGKKMIRSGAEDGACKLTCGHSTCRTGSRSGCGSARCSD